MTRPSKRKLESTVDDLDGKKEDSGDGYQQRRAEARDRLEADEYDDDTAAGVRRLWDAYAVAYEDKEDWYDAIGKDFEYLSRSSLGFKAYQAKEFDQTLPKLPPVPTEAVAEAIIEMGAPHVDGDTLRDRHNGAWIRRFVENLHYERRRLKAKRTGESWDPETVEEDIRQWRELYREQHGAE